MSLSRYLTTVHHHPSAAKRVGRWLLVLVAGTILPAASVDSAVPLIERYAYVEASGARKIPITYVIETDAHVDIRVQRAGEHFFNRCEMSGATTEWHYRHGPVDVQVLRENRSLLVRGHRNGRSFEKRHHIDDAPWFQPLSYALRPFLKSGQRSVSFWFMRSDNFKPVKLQAVRAGTEEIYIGGQRFSGTRVDVSPVGALSFVWQGSYWFEGDDGIFLQYAGGHLFSGAEDTVIRLRPDAPK